VGQDALADMCMLSWQADGIVIKVDPCEAPPEEAPAERGPRGSGGVMGVWTVARQMRLGHLHDNLLFGVPLPF
jgi:hypothetical protein